MADTPTRAEFEALQADVAAIRDDLAEALRLTGCTDRDNNRRDRALRDRQAWRESPEGQEYEATLRALVDWYRHQQRDRDEARQRLGDWAARLGLLVTVGTLVTGFLSGAAWAVLALIRWVNGGAP